MGWNGLSERWKNYFRQQLWLAQSMSKDANTKVGALIIDTQSKVVVASGWNDLPRGVQHTPERNERPLKYLYTSHAEQSTLTNALRLGHRVNGLTMLCSLACCAQCSASVVNSGIGEVVSPVPNFNRPSYGEEFHHSVAIMKEGGVKWVYDNSLTKEEHEKDSLAISGNSGTVCTCSSNHSDGNYGEVSGIACSTFSRSPFAPAIRTGENLSVHV